MPPSVTADMGAAEPDTDQSYAVSKPPKPTLLTLPGELRNRIYRLVVVPEETVIVTITCSRKDDKKAYLNIQPRQPALTYATKAMQRDVASTYFSEAVFSVTLRSWDHARFE